MLELFLFRNHIGDAGVEKLAPVLRGMINLKTLSLSQNEIGDDGADKLAKAMVGMTSLRVLELGGNNINHACIKELRSAALKAGVD